MPKKLSRLVELFKNMIESEIRKRDLKELIKLVSQYFPYESFLTKMGVPIKMFDKRSNLVFKEICHDKE